MHYLLLFISVILLSDDTNNNSCMNWWHPMRSLGKWRTNTQYQMPRILHLLLRAEQPPTRSPWRSHHHPVQEQRGKVWLLLSLLAIVGKILARVLVNRLVSTVAEEHLPECQCGFRTNGGTNGMVFALRVIQEKCLKQNKGVFITSVNLSKAFDIMSRKVLGYQRNFLGPSKSQTAWNNVAFLLQRFSRYSPACQRRPWWRGWCLHSFSYRWQPVQRKPTERPTRNWSWSSCSLMILPLLPILTRPCSE